MTSCGQNFLMRGMKHVHHLALLELGRLVCLRLGKLSGESRVTLLGNDTEDTLSDASGQDVGPLVYRLVGDAHGLSGSGDRTAEDFNGL